jgi:hypothetical protein
MPAYLISYDLNRGSRTDYQELYDAIKSYRTWARIAESTWIVVTDMTAKEIRDHLISFTDEKDRLFVLKSGVAAAWRNVRCRNEWLKKWL